MLFMEKFLDLINSITFLSNIVDLIFLYFLSLSENNFPISPNLHAPSKLSIKA